jgi:hypothetical protein
MATSYVSSEVNECDADWRAECADGMSRRRNWMQSSRITWGKTAAAHHGSVGEDEQARGWTAMQARKEGRAVMLGLLQTRADDDE